jgi:hypothetical protein
MNPMDMSGGGGYSADFGATATNTGGTNTVGGTVFGNYTAPSNGSNLLPWLIGGAVVLGVVFMVKGGK